MYIGALSDESIAAYRREAPPTQKETEQQKRLVREGRRRRAGLLRELRELLDSKKLQIEACAGRPARGTTLLSDPRRLLCLVRLLPRQPRGRRGDRDLRRW